MLKSQQRIEHREAFEVCVGFARVRVEGDSPEEVIENARRQFCLEMPRMWDLFTDMPDQRFKISPKAP